jgi:hypothetical protein
MTAVSIDMRARRYWNDPLSLSIQAQLRKVVPQGPVFTILAYRKSGSHDETRG